jgi:glutamyl-Q tRNA(Asp) synthetase
LNARAPQPALIAALRFLGQSAPDELRDATPRELLARAVAHWRPDAMPRERTQLWTDL